jgi:F-type H+-transporting ATPase subunit delta
MSANKSFSIEASERYSRALFEVAQEASDLEKIENDIKNFASLMNNSLEIKNFIHNPTQSKENQNNVIKLLAEKLNFFEKFKKLYVFINRKKKNIFHSKNYR